MTYDARMTTRLLPALLVGVIACGTPEPSAPDAITPDAGAVACDAATWGTALTPYIEGLLYLSESDRPLEPVSWASATTGAIGASEVAAASGLDATTIEVRDYEAWFDRVAVAQDWMDDGQKASAAKFAELRRFLDTQLTQRTVVRIGKVEVHVFVVGRDACGRIAGFSTVAIET